MSFYLKKLAEPETFQGWRENFEKKNEEAFQFLDDAMVERGIEESKRRELEYYFARACFDAEQFKNINKELRKKETEAFTEIRGKGKNPIKAIEELETFFKRNQESAKIIAEYWFPEVFGSSPNPPKRLAGKKPIEMLTYSLDRLKYSTGLYAEKARKWGYSPLNYGPLSYPRAKDQERIEETWDIPDFEDLPGSCHHGNKGQKRIKSHSKPEVDGLIFELALLIHCYLQNIPITADIMEIPKGSRLDKCDEIISRFVNATLNKKATSKMIHNRLDYLKKSGARWVDWEQYKQ